jgi:hypothetical protein
MSRGRRSRRSRHTYSHGTRGDFHRLPTPDHRAVLLLAKYFLPALMRGPLITALPIDIFLIREATRKISQKLCAAPFRPIRDRFAKLTAAKALNILSLNKAPCRSEAGGLGAKHFLSRTHII